MWSYVTRDVMLKWQEGSAIMKGVQFEFIYGKPLVMQNLVCKGDHKLSTNLHQLVLLPV